MPGGALEILHGHDGGAMDHISAGTAGCCVTRKGSTKPAKPLQNDKSGRKHFMKIQILGTGCPKCRKLTALAEEAAKELGISYELEKVDDVNDIIAFGVMTTPGLAVDGRVLTSGKVPSAAEVKKLLQQAAQA